MEIIHIATGDYQQYEEAVLKRDKLQKQAHHFYILYINTFGDLMIKDYELKLKCISLKKEIAYYVMLKNRGESATRDEVEQFLQKQMAEYQEKLNELTKEHKLSKSRNQIMPEQAKTVKNIYRNLAKQLHPDISPLTSEHPELKVLFQRAVIAYKCNDVKELQAVEVLVNKSIAEKGIVKVTQIIPDIAQRIKEVYEDTDRILNSEPYTLRYVLEDPDVVTETKRKLNDSITSFTDYKIRLTRQRDNIREEM